jgi:S-adenosylmethionine:tRNA ribosyltransferase-isomerase
VYSKHKGSVAAPTAGLHFTPQILQRLSDKGVNINELTLHVGAGTFRPVHHNDVRQHDMHVEFFSVHLDVIRNLMKNEGVLTVVGTTSLRALESIYWLGVKMLHQSRHCGLDPQPRRARQSQSPIYKEIAGQARNDDLVLQNLQLDQWEAYHLPQDIPVEQSLSKVCETLEANQQNILYASTKILIVPGYTFRICKRLITNFHQPQSTLLLLVGAFVGEQWKEIYQYAMEHDFRFLSYGDGSLLELSSVKITR